MLIKQNVPLKDYSNYKIGGPAAFFAEVSGKEDIASVIEEFEKDLPIFILGKGTNILISEKGFQGLIIHDNILGIKRVEEKVEVGAGVLVSDLLDFCIENSLSGLEWAGGLPGTVGGAVRGNAGAFKGETKDSISEVESISLKSLDIVKRTNKECNFSYRSSIFKQSATDELITKVAFSLQTGQKEEIQKLTQEKIDYRNEKHPMDYPSIGSTFKNIPLDSISDEKKKEFASFVKDDPFPVIPVAKLLFLCELKGERVGDAQISEKHPNFIINLGNAKAEDVKKLINIAKEKVFAKFGLKLEEEIMYL